MTVILARCRMEGCDDEEPHAVTDRSHSPADDGGKGPLFFQRRFLPMWVALSFGTFADNTLRQALLIGIPAGIVSVPFLKSPDDAIPLVGALLPLAILIFSSVSGQLADKYETSFMFRRTKAVEVALMLVAGAAFVSGIGGLAIAMLFFMGAQSAFFSPVRVAAMPKYLARNELVRGNGLCNAGLFTFILLGYVTGGMLITREHGGDYVAMALVIASLIGFAGALRAPYAAANDPELKLSVNGFSQAAFMFRNVFAAPGVAAPLFGVAAFFFLSTLLTVVIPLYGRDALYATPAVWAALNGFFAIGAGVGAVSAANLPKHQSGLVTSGIAIAAAGACSIALYLATPLAAGAPDAPLTLARLITTPGGLLLVAIMIASSALSGLYIAPLQAAMQRRAPSAVRARIMAASAFMNALFAIPGSLCLLLVTRTGADPRLVFAAAGMMMMAIAGLMAYRRRTRPAGAFDENLDGGKG
ncbi:MAG: MFS transporter [Parvularculaceae bacterium]